MEYQPPPTADTPAFQVPTEALIEAPPPSDIRALKDTCELGLREYAAKRTQGGAESENVRAMAGIVAANLRLLRSEVSAIRKKCVAHRWRKWLLGGIVAAIIPAVRKIFRRSSNDRVSSNNTEHAFQKSKSIIARILDSIKVHGKSGIASVALFVLTVLYLFQSEVAVRVARTVSKRLKRLVERIESGAEELCEQDFKILSGWRWRVLLW
ncbi:hypothetical protein GGS21DRAFT_364990 [Xylaria nigripes]|nr:hypothetical protein GGS21DRAFT_364990 [Xylaria nigripes]